MQMPFSHSKERKPHPPTLGNGLSDKWLSLLLYENHHC